LHNTSENGKNRVKFLGGDKLHNNIQCQVLNCHFNSEGICEADGIEVKPQGNVATSSLTTFCETFVPRDDDSDDAYLI